MDVRHTATNRMPVSFPIKDTRRHFIVMWSGEVEPTLCVMLGLSDQPLTGGVSATNSALPYSFAATKLVWHLDLGSPILHRYCRRQAIVPVRAIGPIARGP